MRVKTDNVYSAFGPKLSLPGALYLLLVFVELGGMYIF